MQTTYTDEELRMDEYESIYFKEDLTKVSDIVLVKPHPKYNAMEVIPTRAECDPADEHYSYQVLTRTGVAKVIAEGADDIPTVSVYGEKFYTDIVSTATSFIYTWQDARKARKTGKSLPVEKMKSAKEAMERLLDEIGFFGSYKNGNKVTGLLTHPNITTQAATDAWTNLTPQEIYDEIVRALDAISDATKETDFANAICLPRKRLTLIKSKAMYPDSGDPRWKIIDELLSNYPEIRFVFQSRALTPFTGRPANPEHSELDGEYLAVYYKYDPDTLHFEIPLLMEVLPEERTGLKFKVILDGRTGGVINKTPLTTLVQYGI